ncbi:MAG TPA: helix-turn-helix transcriptional regulator [Jatrophihabitans sp.]|jgi:DNA-binding NarL/FixJ family response regulator
MGDEASIQTNLIDYIVGRFLNGDEEAAEWACRLALRSDYSLLEIYEKLRIGIERARVIRSDGFGTLERSLLDESLGRIVARLQPPLTRKGPCVVIVLAGQTPGIASSLAHLITKCGLVAATLPMSVLSSHSADPVEMATWLASVRYMVADSTTATGQQMKGYLQLVDAVKSAAPKVRFTMLVPYAANTDLMHEAHQRGVAVARDLAGLLETLNVVAVNPLTRREQEVLRFVAAGSTNEQAARALGVSLASIKTYLERAHRKLQSHDRASAVAVALQREWLRVGEPPAS